MPTRYFTTSDIPFSPADPKTFTGSARVARLATGDEPGGVRVYRVDFDRDARLHWHAHNGPQWLFVVEGCCRVQKRGEPARDSSPARASASRPTPSTGTAPPRAEPARTSPSISARPRTGERGVTDEEYQGEV